MWQQQAGEWCIYSPWPITIRYTSRPVSAPIVIYSCPVIRPACTKRKKSICLPSVFLPHYVWTISLRELLCMQSAWVPGYQGCFQPCPTFVLLETLVFSYIIETFIKPRHGHFHASSSSYAATAYLLLTVSSLLFVFTVKLLVMIPVWVKRSASTSKYGRNLWRRLMWPTIQLLTSRWCASLMYTDKHTREKQK